MLKQSILKRPTTAYLSVEDNNSDMDRQNGGMSLKFSPANSTQNSQKNVRFSGIEFKQYNNTPNIAAGIPPKPQPRQQKHQQLQSSTTQFEINKDDYFELEKTQFPNEIGIKKYYKKSKTVPCKQIKLVGLNDEFIVANQPIQRHIQRELIAQQNQQQKEQQKERSTSSNKTRSQLRTTSARPFSDNHNRSLMYPNVFRVAPSPSNQSSKSSNTAATSNTLNNLASFYSMYDGNSGTVSSYQSSSLNRSGQHNYYHWQGSENAGKSPNCESVSNGSTTTSSNQNTNSLTTQHSKLINLSTTQLKSSLVKMNSKRTKNKSNLNALFSPSSSMQSYSTYQTVSHLSNASENGILDSTISTLNGSASQSYPESQSQVTRDQSQQQSQAQAAEAGRSKTPSSLTLYTYLLDSNKTSKEPKASIVRSQTKKYNYEQVYMKNLVPKIQKLGLKEHGNSHALRDVSRDSSLISASIRQSINPVNESPSNYNSKINYKIFAEKPERRDLKLANGLQNMKITLRSESASS